MLNQRSCHALTRLLAPLEPATFFARYWEREPLFLPGPPDKFRGLFDRSALDRAIRLAPRARLTSGTQLDLKATFLDAGGRQVEVGVSPDQVDEMLRAGMTICAQGVDIGDPSLKDFLAEVKRELAFWGKLHFNGYLSPHGEGFGTHFDDHSIWNIQLEGAKRWRFSPQPAVDSPIENLLLPPVGPLPGPPHGRPERPDEASFFEALLEPGCVLYLPAGTWHRAEAVGTSLALTLRGPRQTPVDLLYKTFERLLYASPAWRRNLPVIATERLRSGDIPPELEALLASRLEELRAFVSSLEVSELCRTWYRAVAGRESSTPESAPAAGGTPRDGAPISPDEVLELAAEPPLYFAAGQGEEETLFVYQHGREGRLPGQTRPVLEGCLRHGRFVARAALEWVEGDYGWDEVKAPLAGLVSMGVLRRCGRAS